MLLNGTRSFSLIFIIKNCTVPFGGKFSPFLMLIESAFGVYTMGLRSTSVRGSLFRMLRESKRNGSKEARQGERVEIEVGFAEHTKECSRGKTHA